MDLEFYNKCNRSNILIKNIESYLKEKKNDKIIRELKSIKNIRIINTYIDTTINKTKKTIHIYPGISFELILANNLIIEISCPPEKNSIYNLFIEIDIINEMTRKKIKDQYLYNFPITLHKIDNIYKELFRLSMLNIVIIKN